jgi:5-methylthioadenosine/S-adenosylhomocysteine deaminase
VAETTQEVADVRREHGKRPVQLLHDLGFVGSDTLLVHCVYLSRPEIRSLRRSATHVVHCPSNHMMLAKGVTPVPALLQAGVNVGLGVDTMGDLFEEARQEVLLQGLYASQPSAISPETALGMATWRGAAALGMSGDLGRLQVGERADLICIDVSDLHLQPILDPIWTIVHRAHGHDVAHVLVDGRVVVESGRLVNVDERALVEEAKQISARYLRRAGVDKQEVMA